MRRPPSLNPFFPVPRAEQQRLLLLAHLSLAELRTGQQHALADLAALVGVCRELVTGDRYTDDAHHAVEAAGQALQGLVAGTVSQAATVAAFGALLPVFESLLCSVTWRRLQAAQDAARRAAA